MKITFAPTKDNPNLFGIGLQASAKLAPQQAVVTTGYAALDAEGKACASEMMPGIKPDQHNMLDHTDDNVTDINPETGEVIDFRKAHGGK